MRIERLILENGMIDWRIDGKETDHSESALIRMIEKAGKSADYTRWYDWQIEI